jgi:hypothetical protein
MASLTDLFNPTFLMFLGILMLVVALLILYFENKMREQNHKIASMLSLVSTLADDMNGVKMGLNHLAIRGGQGFQNPHMPLNSSNLGTNSMVQHNNNLIEVSDNDSEDDDEDEEELEELESEGSEFDNNSINESDDDDEDNIKVIKLNVSNEDTEDNNESIEFDEVEDLADLDTNDELPEMDDNYVEQILDLKYEEKQTPLEEEIIHSKDLKTISINLGDEQVVTTKESIDYKKLQIPKLRSIAIEKGLTTNSEANKLKKSDILKLLGAE